MKIAEIIMSIYIAILSFMGVTFIFKIDNIQARLQKVEATLSRTMPAAQLAAIHQPNDNKYCQRPGCGHYHNQHEKGNGMCLYTDPFTLPGHCPGFVK